MKWISNLIIASCMVVLVTTPSLAPAHASTSHKSYTTVQIGWIKVAAQAAAYIAHEMHYDHQFGVDFELTAYPTAPLSAQAVITGNAQAAYAGSVPTGPSLIQHGAPIRSVMIYAEGGNRLGLVTLDPSITSIASLRGKKVATVLGSDPQEFILKALKKHKVPADSVQLINMQYADMGTALVTHQVDAATITQPTLSVFRQANPSARVIERAGNYLALAGSLFMRQDFIHTSKARATYAAIAKAMQYIRKQGATSKRIGTLLAPGLGLSVDQTRAAMRDSLFDPRITPWVWQHHKAEIAFYRGLNVLTGNMTQKQLYSLYLQDWAMKKHPELFNDITKYLTKHHAPKGEIKNVNWGKGKP